MRRRPTATLVVAITVLAVTGSAIAIAGTNPPAGGDGERSARAIGAGVVGQPEVVFSPDDMCPSWVNPDPNAPPEAHKIHDVPDQPARAFRNHRGETVLVAANRVTRLAIGPDLDRVRRDCSDPPAWASRYANGPWSFDVRSWLTSTYTTDGRKVYALMSADYKASEDSRARRADCPSGVKKRCWFNAITWAVSRDGGATFSRPRYRPGHSPSYVVASIPYQYAPDAGPMGYFSPSNIMRGMRMVGGRVRATGFYYSMFKAESHRAQKKGACLIRTKTLSKPGSWRAWGGRRFDVRLVNPYHRPSRSYPAMAPHPHPGRHVCKPVSPGQISTMHKSLSYNTYLRRYVLVSADSVKGTEGVFYSTSRDLVHWAPRRLLWAQPIKNQEDPPAPADVISYASLLDPASGNRNYLTSGQRPYLYYVGYDWHCDPGDDPDRCGTADSRNLSRIRVEFRRAG